MSHHHIRQSDLLHFSSKIHRQKTEKTSLVTCRTCSRESVVKMMINNNNNRSQKSGLKKQRWRCSVSPVRCPWMFRPLLQAEKDERESSHGSVAPLCGGTVLQGSANLCVAVRVDPKTPDSLQKQSSQPETDTGRQRQRHYRQDEVIQTI